MTFNETVGQNILNYLERKGIKKCAVADYLNEKCNVRFDSAKISITLHGRRVLNLDEYKYICDFLGVDYNTFLKNIKEAK